MDQTSDDERYRSLRDWAVADERVVELPSQASLPGAVGLTIRFGLLVRVDALIVGRELAHIHAEPGMGSLHLRLHDKPSTEVVKKG